MIFDISLNTAFSPTSVAFGAVTAFVTAATADVNAASTIGSLRASKGKSIDDDLEHAVTSPSLALKNSFASTSDTNVALLDSFDSSKELGILDAGGDRELTDTIDDLCNHTINLYRTVTGPDQNFYIYDDSSYPTPEKASGQSAGSSQYIQTVYNLCGNGITNKLITTSPCTGREKGCRTFTEIASPIGERTYFIGSAVVTDGFYFQIPPQGPPPPCSGPRDAEINVDVDIGFTDFHSWEILDQNGNVRFTSEIQSGGRDIYDISNLCRGNEYHFRFRLLNGIKNEIDQVTITDKDYLSTILSENSIEITGDKNRWGWKEYKKAFTIPLPPSMAPSSPPSQSFAPSDAPSEVPTNAPTTEFKCTNNPDPFSLRNGKKMTCTKVAKLSKEKMRKYCKNHASIRENCPSVCQKKKCPCENWPAPFQAGGKPITCDFVAGLPKKKQKKRCKNKLYQDRCPQVCLPKKCAA